MELHDKIDTLNKRLYEIETNSSNSVNIKHKMTNNILSNNITNFENDVNIGNKSNMNSNINSNTNTNMNDIGNKTFSNFHKRENSKQHLLRVSDNDLENSNKITSTPKININKNTKIKSSKSIGKVNPPLTKEQIRMNLVTNFK